MTNYPTDQVCSPPELPPYLKNVYGLKQIVGVPNDEEVIGIHAVIRMAHKFVDVPEMCNPTLLLRLSEHLFDAQTAKHRSQYPCSIFPTNTTYTPPALPAHVSPNLEPVTGTPSDEVVIKVQVAVRFYQRFADVPTMFDAQLHADLSQHLFDIQMERYMRRCNSTQTSPLSRETTAIGSGNPAQPTGQTDEHVNMATNNAGTGAEDVPSYRYPQVTQDAVVRDVIERSNRLAEDANQISTRSNLLIERANESAEQSRQLVERSNELFEKLNKHFEKSSQENERANRPAGGTINPVLKFGDIPRDPDTSAVRFGVKPAISRNHKGNTPDEPDGLVNLSSRAPVPVPVPVPAVGIPALAVAPPPVKQPSKTWSHLLRPVPARSVNAPHRQSQEPAPVPVASEEPKKTPERPQSMYSGYQWDD